MTIAHMTKCYSAISTRVFIVFVILLVSGCGAARWQDDEPIESEPATGQTDLSRNSQSDSRPISQPNSQPAWPPISLPNSQAISVKDRLINYYRQWESTPYLFGGTSKAGIDCSAFTQQAMHSSLGIKLPRTTSQQLGAGIVISADDIVAGDLAFFKTGQTLNHVGIVIGDNKFIHASESKGVTISRLDDRYWRSRLISYRRVLALVGK